MFDFALAFRLFRNVMATVGTLACVAVLALFAALFLHDSSEQPATQASPAPPAPTLQEASWLLSAAGLDTEKNGLHLVASGRREPDGRDDSGAIVQAWCLQAARWPALDPHWQPASALEPVFARTLTTALDSVHAQAPCLPTPSDVAYRGLRVRLTRVEFNDGRALSATIALADSGSGAIYLVNASLLPASPSPGSPAQASPAPSTE